MNNISIFPAETLEPIILTAASPSSGALAIGGDFVHCLSADEDFELRIDRATRGVPLFSNGRFYMPRDARGERQKYSFIEVRRKSSALLASNSVTLIVGAGDYFDGRATFTNAIDIQTPPLLSTAADAAIPNAAATQVLAANPFRREAFLYNASATTFRVGDANVGAARGIFLATGGTIVLTTSAAVYVYQNSGAAANLAVAETLMQ